jgi:hypothetical protein
MPRYILTDATEDIWLDTFSLDASMLTAPMPGGWSVRKRTLRGGLRDGVDLVTLCNGALRVNVLPTRGMGLWNGDYRGTFLGWRAPISGPVHPRFVDQGYRNGIGWLAGFDEWLCRCGLGWNGPPGNDNGAALTLHGRIANQPAQRVEVSVNPEPPFELAVSGVVEEAGLFLGRLRLTATYVTTPGSNRLVIRDVVENRGGTEAEMQMLYHLNFGPPLLAPGGRVVVPAMEVAPHTDHAAQAIDRYAEYAPPVAGFAEEVYDFRAMAGADHRTLALLRDKAGFRGCVVRWDVRQLPCFTVWKNTAAEVDGYVTGLEPGTNFPFFRAHERQQGRVVKLPPGGRWESIWSIEVLDLPGAVAAVEQEIAGLQAKAPATIHRKPVFAPPA